MKRDDAINAIKPHMSNLRALGVVSLAIFGSTARNEASEGSDVDVLVTFDKTPTFRQFMDVKSLLERALGHRVDMGRPEALRPEIRAKVLSEAVRVA